MKDTKYRLFEMMNRVAGMPLLKESVINEDNQNSKPNLPSWASPDDFMSLEDYIKSVPCSTGINEEDDDFIDLNPPSVEVSDMQQLIRQKQTDIEAGKKQDVEHGGRLHRAMIDAIYKGDSNDEGEREYDLEELKNILRIEPNEDQLIGQNGKMLKTNFHNITLPAYRGIYYDERQQKFFIINVCDKAKDCTIFCFAQLNYFVKNSATVQLNAQKLNYLLNHGLTWQSRVINKINLLNDGVNRTIVRWHDSGDFFSEQYMKLAFDIADETKFAEHYAYTKSVGIAKSFTTKPPNIEFKFSYGGLDDHLIDPEVDGYAVVIPPKYFQKYQPMEQKIEPKTKRKYMGKGWNFTPESIELIKDAIFADYGTKLHLVRNNMITVNDLKKIPYNPNDRKWIVISKSGDSDISAYRRDVQGVLLLQHK